MGTLWNRRFLLFEEALSDALIVTDTLWKRLLFLLVTDGPPVGLFSQRFAINFLRGSHWVTLVGLELSLRTRLASNSQDLPFASLVLGLKVCTIIPSKTWCFVLFCF